MIVVNPILPGFHPDPCALRVGRDYYVATSTFEWFPGVEIHHSTDLAHWRLVARPLDTPELLDLRDVPNSGGVWAPCLSYSDGIFYLVYSVARTVEETTQDTENYLTCAQDVRGPWSPRVRLHSGGFDASMFHDPDGSHWIVGMRWDSRAERDHFAGIYLQEYSVTRQRLLGEARCIFHGSPLGMTEGPHLYAVDGGYLLLVAEGGTREGHAALACKSLTRDGDYRPDPQGPLLTARHRPDWPIQHAGHGSLVEGPDGRWYLFHLGARKQEFGGYSVLGRETFLQAVCWNTAGYPRLADGDVLPRQTVEVLAAETERPESAELARQAGEHRAASTGEAAGDPRAAEPPEFVVAASAQLASLAPGAPGAALEGLRSAFDGPALPLWLAWLREPARHSLAERPGYLRLYGAESLLSKHRQSLLGTQLYRVPLSLRTQVDFQPTHFQQAAGIALYYHTANFYALLVTWDDGLGRCVRLTKRDSKRTTLLAPMRPLPPRGEVGLRADVTAKNIRFYVDAGSGWAEIGNPADQPVAILSDEYANLCQEQGYTGAFAALCCQDQTGAQRAADFAFFSLCPPTLNR